jgi:hypothetical protein
MRANRFFDSARVSSAMPCLSSADLAIADSAIATAGAAFRRGGNNGGRQTAVIREAREDVPIIATVNGPIANDVHRGVGPRLAVRPPAKAQ